MSISRNHHYVSQCHMREFFNKQQGKIYVYDKILDNFYSRTSTKHLFSEEDANAKVINGRIDYLQMETELKVMFEDDFPKHLKTIQNFSLDQSNIEEAYWALNFMALIGIVGEYRNPAYKLSIDQTLGKFEKDVFCRINQAPPSAHVEKLTKYDNRAGYMHIAFKIFEKMDPIVFSIYIIDSNDHFLLPDTSCFHIRSNGAIGEILQLGIPINDKVFVLATSKKVNKEQTQIVTFHEDDCDEVFRINTDLSNFAYKGIACSDMDFLRKTISRIKKGE